MINGSVEDSEFQEWVVTARSRFETMVLTMVDVAELINANTYMKVPLDTGRLQESFHWDLREESPDRIVVDIIYDAEDPKTGFHYAEIQHQNTRFNHPKRGEAFYLFKGIKSSLSDGFDMIERDYLSLFGDRT